MADCNLVIRVLKRTTHISKIDIYSQHTHTWCLNFVCARPWRVVYDKGLCDLAGAAFVTSCTGAKGNSQHQNTKRKQIDVIFFLGQLVNVKAADCDRLRRSSVQAVVQYITHFLYCNMLPCANMGASHASIHSHAARQPLNGDISRSYNYFQHYTYTR